MRACFMILAVLVCTTVADPESFDAHYLRLAQKNPDRERCYDDNGKPRKCLPPFENAAFNVLMKATNTCGEDGIPTEYCMQTGEQKKSCAVCRKGDHDAVFLTDQDNKDNGTWWQSQTMFEGIQDSNKVQITLALGKSYDITYIRLLFISPRPQSMGIYRKKMENSTWLPYQFYSTSCRDTYRLPDSTETTRADDSQVLCTSEYSDISPLQNGIVAFATLEGRPSANNFEANAELQEWVQATELMFSLDKLNTFGDELFGDDQVLKSYYYAIADIAVGARCTCNGHASECLNTTNADGTRRKYCRCEHNTAGPDCNECLPFYNDLPWGRATPDDAHECQPCNCNGYSDRCYFDEELYRQTGHGGHCIDCAANRAGANCERCRENYYQHPEDNYCVACNCNEIGSRSLQCNIEGKCQCKTGVTGDKCDRCAANFYDFGQYGCKSCECDVAGSFGNTPSCDPVTGTCSCKDNVEGKRCGMCKPGFFNLAIDNEFGCTPCYCHGHSSVCRSASGYSKFVIESIFVRGVEKWKATVGDRNVPIHFDSISQSIVVTAPDRDNVYFEAPERFLGDQRASYNQYIAFTLKIGETEPTPTAWDVILEGGNGEQITQTILGQNNVEPGLTPREYRFKLHEHEKYQWQPRLSSKAFMSVLANLTAIKIRATYTHQGRGYLDDMKLETAKRGAAGKPADWVEHCDCPNGYVGQFCESCAPKFHHDPPNGGPFALCVPCNCNGHASICDSETGQCICEHNTAGSNCELCKRGYYGYPLKGTADDCQPCPCPDNGSCILLGKETTPICTECPLGRSGHRCETCSDGYFGNPEQGIPCRPCDCNNNIDLNAVRNCHNVTGVCLKCVNNTAGLYCEECASGYHGDALASTKEEGCNPCHCNLYGTLELIEGGIVPCDKLTGYCSCKPHVTGKNCDRCEDGYYDIRSGEGCKACNCDPEGSYNRTCDSYTGKCNCRPGITGQRCDICEPYQYGFSRDGCKPCDCDQSGSQDLQCDANGQCPCHPNVEGRRCDRCKENKQNRQNGCIDCPPCYNLVQDAVNTHRKRLAELEGTLRKINSSPTVIKDSDFEKELQDMQRKVNDLLNLAKQGSGSGNKTLVEQLDDLRDQLNEIDTTSRNSNIVIEDAREKTKQAKKSIAEAESVSDKIYAQLKEIDQYLEKDGKGALNEAKQRAEQVGQQNAQMTIIAKEARISANINLNAAKNIRDMAMSAKKTSLEAYDLAKQSITRYTDIRSEIMGLETKLKTLEDRFDAVQDTSADAAEKSALAAEKAYSLLVSDLTLPDINVAELQNKIESVSDKGIRIKEQVQVMMERNVDLLDEIKNKINKSEALLIQAEMQQSMTAEFLAEVDQANIQAKDAVERAKKTFEEAEETLKKLSAFDAEVQKEKDKAQKALQNLEQTKKLIDEVIEKSQNANEVLTASESLAMDIANFAEQAKEVAFNAEKEASLIEKETNKTKSEVFRLGSETETLRLRVGETETLIKNYQDRVWKDVNITNEVNHKVGQAKTNVTAVDTLVHQALDEVKKIMRELESLPEIDDSELNRLEEKLTEAEKEIEKVDLDRRINELTNAKNKQSRRVNDYRDEVARLQDEVRNIEEIRNALPTRCFKRVGLEPS